MCRRNEVDLMPGIIFATINYIGFKSMAFATEFNAFNMLVCAVLLVGKAFSVKSETEILNPYKLASKSSCASRQTAAAWPFNSMKPCGKKKKAAAAKKNVASSFVRPKLNVDCIFCVRFVSASTFLATQPFTLYVWYLRRLKIGECARVSARYYRHYVANALIIFSFICSLFFLRSLILFKTND